MSWKNLTIGKKIGVGFTVVLALLVVLGIMSYSGVSGIDFPGFPFSRE